MTRLGENKRCRYDTLKCPNRYCDTVSGKLCLVENAVIDFLTGWIEEYKVSVEKNSPMLPKSTLEICKSNISALSAELETVNKQISKTYDLLEQGIYTAELFKERNENLSNKKAELENKLTEAKDKLEEYRARIAVHGNFIPHFENVLAVYQTTADIDEKNRLIKTIVQRITYMKSERNTRRNANDASFQLLIEPIVE